MRPLRWSVSYSIPVDDPVHNRICGESRILMTIDMLNAETFCRQSSKQLRHLCPQIFIGGGVKSIRISKQMVHATSHVRTIRPQDTTTLRLPRPACRNHAGLKFCTINILLEPAKRARGHNLPMSRRDNRPGCKRYCFDTRIQATTITEQINPAI